MTLEPVHPWGATPDPHDDWCEFCWHGDGDARCIVCGRSTGGLWSCDCVDGPTIGPCAASPEPEWRETCHRCGAKWAGPTTPLPSDSLGRKVCPPFDAANCEARTAADRGPRNDFRVFSEAFIETEFVRGDSVPRARTIRCPVPVHPAVMRLTNPNPRPTSKRPGFWHNVAAHPLLVLWPRLGEWLHERTRP